MRPNWAIWAAVLVAICGCGRGQPTGPQETLPAAGEWSPRVRFVEGFASGRQQALAEGKPMLVFFSAQWCDYCHSMADEIAADDRFVQLAERFVCVLVDADGEPQVCRELRVRAFPTIQFVSPRGVPLNRLTGKQPVQQVLIEMQAALQALARQPTAADSAVQR